MKGVLGLGASVIVAAGCGGHATVEAGGATPIPYEQFGDLRVETYCGGLQGCCDVAGHPFDATACRDWMGSSPLPAASRVVYDAAAAGECIETMRASLASCRDPWGASSACDRVFRGRVLPGGACDSSWECAGDLPDCHDGACIAVPHGTLSSPCDATCFDVGSATACAFLGGEWPGMPNLGNCHRNDGLHCSRESETCVAVGARGQPCSEAYGCAVGLICASGTSGGVCAPQVALGGDCRGDDDCTEGFCDDATGLCTAQRANGEACHGFDECAAGFCDEYGTGLCTAPRANGQPCQGWDECVSRNCNHDTGLCEERGSLATAQVCSSSFAP